MIGTNTLLSLQGIMAASGPADDDVDHLRRLRRPNLRSDDSDEVGSCTCGCSSWLGHISDKSSRQRVRLSSALRHDR